MSAATLSVVVVVLILQVAAEPPGPASWWQPVEELWDDFQGDNLNTSKVKINTSSVLVVFQLSHSSFVLLLCSGSTTIHSG